jgi:hypothetical protein
VRRIALPFDRGPIGCAIKFSTGSRTSRLGASKVAPEPALLCASFAPSHENLEEYSFGCASVAPNRGDLVSKTVVKKKSLNYAKLSTRDRSRLSDFKRKWERESAEDQAVVREAERLTERDGLVRMNTVVT